MVGPSQFWMHTLDLCTLIAICAIDSVSTGDTSRPWWWDEISTLESGCMLKFQGCKGYQKGLRNKAFGTEILHNSVHTLSRKPKYVQYYKAFFLDTALSKSILWSCRCIKILLRKFKCFVEVCQNPSRSWYDTLYPMLHEIGSSKIMPWCFFCAGDGNCRQVQVDYNAISSSHVCSLTLRKKERKEAIKGAKPLTSPPKRVVEWSPPKMASNLIFGIWSYLRRASSKSDLFTLMRG